MFSIVVGDHFIQGDELPRNRSTTARAINHLKEIMFNTRLDQFLTPAPGFCKQVTSYCFKLFFSSVLFASVPFNLFTNRFLV